MTQTISEPRTWQPILDQLRKPGGLALGFVGIALALLTVFVLPTWQVPVQWPIGLIIVALAYLWISRSALREAGQRINSLSAEIARSDCDSTRSLEPRVVQSMISPSDENEVILLLQPNRLFGQSMLVSIYYEDERNFELLVASGRVLNVQTNGLIQVAVTAWQASHDEVRRAVIAQQVDKLAMLLVRPAPTTSTPLALDEQRLLEIIQMFQIQRAPDDE